MKTKHNVEIWTKAVVRRGGTLLPVKITLRVSDNGELPQAVQFPFIDYKHGGFGMFVYSLQPQRTVTGLPVYQ